jgi:lipoprotein-releasing system permease protein
MYKLLLALRYLRTRFIALASVISVMLGVATMIVVNSVMTGFSVQMKDRIRGIRSDVCVQTMSTDGVEDPVGLMHEIKDSAGQYIDSMTPSVEVYGMMSFKWLGRDCPRPVTIVGIEPESREMVTPMRRFLANRRPTALENGESVPPAIAPETPLNWELTADAQKIRKSWLEFARLRQQYESRMEAPPAPSETIVQASGTGDQPAASATEGGTNPFDFGPSNTSDQISPFPAVENNAPSDPYAPQNARVFVAEGLVSYHHPNKETGKLDVKMMVSPGMDVNLTTYKSGTPQPGSMTATIVDVFKCGMSEYDSSLVFCNLEEVQRVRGMLLPTANSTSAPADWKNGAVTNIQIKLKDYADASLVVEKLRRDLDIGIFTVRTWEQEQGPLLQAVEVESAILNVLLFLIIAVAGFGILAIFYMIVVEKTKDIGILKALGANSRGIMSIFLSYGLSLGVVGSGVGVVLGLLIVHYINEVEMVISMIMGHKVFDETIYYFNEIPTKVNVSMVIWVAFGATTIAVLASVLPARFASRMHPVRALRYE